MNILKQKYNDFVKIMYQVKFRDSLSTYHLYRSRIVYREQDILDCVAEWYDDNGPGYTVEVFVCLEGYGDGDCVGALRRLDDNPYYTMSFDTKAEEIIWDKNAFDYGRVPSRKRLREERYQEDLAKRNADLARRNAERQAWLEEQEIAFERQKQEEQAIREAEDLADYNAQLRYEYPL